jgi:hypothetical protein
MHHAVLRAECAPNMTGLLHTEYAQSQTSTGVTNIDLAGNHPRKIVDQVRPGQRREVPREITGRSAAVLLLVQVSRRAFVACTRKNNGPKSPLESTFRAPKCQFGKCDCSYFVAQTPNLLRVRARAGLFPVSLTSYIPVSILRLWIPVYDGLIGKSMPHGCKPINLKPEDGTLLQLKEH